MVRLGPGLPSAVIRFICHIPLGYYGIGGLTAYNGLKNAEQVRLPGTESFLMGLRIAAGMGTFSFVWNFVLWLPSFVIRWPWLPLIGIVDAAIAGSAIATTILLAGFSPHNYSQCKNAQSWRVNGDESSFFTMINQLDHFKKDSEGNPVSPEDNCKQFVLIFAFSIFVSILYSISALSNIVLGIMDRYDGYRPVGHGSIPSVAQEFYRWPLNVVKAFIPRSFIYRVLFLVRYVTKLSQKLRTAGALRLQDMSSKCIYDGYRELSLREASSLATLLNPNLQKELFGREQPYDPLLLIAERLHYIDIVNLSLSSKELRVAIFHSHIRDRLEKVRISCCRGGIKKECRICKILVCQSTGQTSTHKQCLYSIRARESFAAWHVRQCKPVCSSCLRKRTLARKDGKSCLCAEPRSRDPRVYADIEVCRHCSGFDDPRSKLGNNLEKTDREELEHLSTQVPACSTCRTLLPSSGPRWWICGHCERECKSTLHVPWADVW